MLRFSCMAVALLCIDCLTAQEPQLDPLVQLQARVAESLYELPDHVCRLDISRTEVEPNSRRKKPRSRQLDSVSLDVAIVDHKEHYAPPGDANFIDVPPSGLVKDGMISSGAFAAFARDILVNHVGVVRYVGQENLAGELTLRYDYSVELRRSGYRITNEGQSVIAPYRGSFWSSTDGDELLRLTVEAGELPLYLGVERVTTQIDYQSSQFDERAFIIPKRTRVLMFLKDGGESMNETVFASCRTFDSTSALSF